MTSARISADEVRATIGRHMLADGMDLVLDLDRSTPTRLVDKVSGRSYIDLFSHFASAPLGTNHPALLTPEAQARLLRGATNNPSNSDVYTEEMARFVDTFARLGIPVELPHLFVVAGGALAVENALKTAFDWKVRKNLAAGRGERGQAVLHFEKAFHGRSGYTLSLTNTADPRKTKYFPKFDWPRAPIPALAFPAEGENLERTIAEERQSIAAIERAFADAPHDIAAIIIEPIQGEGGDNHFRPEFLAALRQLADEHEAMLIFDEIQTGVGLTGRFWAYEHFGVVPDILCFGKKMQVCGILCGRRVEEVENHVFAESSRINSTWGDYLSNMVRSTLHLEVIEADRLVENAREQGEHLLRQLADVAGRSTGAITNVRGRGLMCAFDLPSEVVRDRFLEGLFERGVLMLGCGERSIRFRPSLCITRADIDEAVAVVVDTLSVAA